MVPPTRRDVLRSGGLAGLGVAGGLSGCLGLFGAGGGAGVDPNSVARDVPGRAGALLHVDVETLLSADDLRTAANAVLAARAVRREGAPGDVDTALGNLQRTYNLDPRKLHRATGFVGSSLPETPTESTSHSPYWGVRGYSDWTASAMYASFRDAAPNRVTESTHADTTVLTIGDESLAAFDDGGVILGSREAVEETIDVAQGRQDGLTGDLRRAFDAASGTYGEFALDLDMAAVASRVLGERAVDAIPVASIRHMYGSMFDDGGDRGVRVVTKLGSATDAEQLAAQVDSFVGIARAQGVDGLLGPFENVVKGVETSTDGKVMTATYRASTGEFNEAAGRLVADFLLGIRQA